MLHLLPSSSCPHRTVVLVMLFHLDSNRRKRKRKRGFEAKNARPPEVTRHTKQNKTKRNVPMVVLVSNRYGKENMLWFWPWHRCILPPWLRPAARQAAGHRWTGMLAVAAQQAPCHSLSCRWTGQTPPADLLADARHMRPGAEGRMPLRAREKEGARSLSVASSADQGQTAARKSPRKQKKTTVRFDLPAALAGCERVSSKQLRGKRS